MVRLHFPFALVASALLAGCGPYPTDMAGTLERIEARHVIRVGVAAIPESGQAAMGDFLARVRRASDARVEAKHGPMESLFADLQRGKLDMVVAEVAEDSPWITEITAIEPIATRRQGERILGLGAIVRNGENRWVALLERQARDMPAGS